MENTLYAMGLTVLVVWPVEGPSKWLREQAVGFLKAPPWGENAKWPDYLTRCYVCVAFWMGLVVGVCTGDWGACLMAPLGFWAWASLPRLLGGRSCGHATAPPMPGSPMPGSGVLTNPLPVEPTETKECDGCNQQA